MTEHRVSVLSSTLRRYEDPTRSRDPRVTTLLERLRTVQVAPEPRAHFRAELRAQLVAVAPRIVAESKAEPAAMIDIVPRPTPAPQRANTPTVWQRLRAIPIARPLGVAATVIMVFALLLGGAVWLSQKSVPGDSLYGLKRAGERVQLSFASSDTERAQEYLDFATTRVDEATQLVSSSGASAAGGGALADGGFSARTSELVSSALTSADSDTMSASRLLGGAAVKTGSSDPLSSMTKWAPTQVKRLNDLAAAMPAGALRSRTTSSTKLVHAAATRANTLEKKVHCGCLGIARSDDLGPVPCAACPAGAPRITPPAVSPPARATVPSNPIGVQHPSGPAGQQQPVTVPSQPPLTQLPTKNPLLPVPTKPLLPSLPINLPTGKPSVPISVGSCVNLLNLIKLGNCPSATP